MRRREGRLLLMLCPVCGHAGRYTVTPREEAPLVMLLSCNVEEGGCGTTFAAEIRMRVEVDYSTCRLELPSLAVQDALQEIETLQEPEPEIPF
jgi:hypothetical protein